MSPRSRLRESAMASEASPSSATSWESWISSAVDSATGGNSVVCFRWGVAGVDGSGLPSESCWARPGPLSRRFRSLSLDASASRCSSSPAPSVGSTDSSHIVVALDGPSTSRGAADEYLDMWWGTTATSFTGSAAAQSPRGWNSSTPFRWLRAGECTSGTPPRLSCTAKRCSSSVVLRLASLSSMARRAISWAMFWRSAEDSSCRSTRACSAS
mmetsp:Transcript_3212/g.9312  ORF Transcript_3212/g.9312 Transcript_3212/m.9312 type:complete len:213 (-) Transcript_3212:227-865(-)